MGRDENIKKVLDHFPIPEYWNWGWYKKFQKEKKTLKNKIRDFYKKLQ